MKSTPTDCKVIPKVEDEQSSGVLESSHPRELTQAAHEQVAGMESSEILAEITEDENDENDLLSAMESCHAATLPVLSSKEDEQSSEILSTSNMKSTPSDVKVISKVENEQSTRVLESPHSIEITEGERSEGMESFKIPTEITEDEDDSLSGRESCHSTTSPALAPAEVNPFMKDLSKAEGSQRSIDYHLDRLKKLLKDNLQMGTMIKFLDDYNRAQQKVDELFYLFDAIEFLIEMSKRNRPKKLRQVYFYTSRNLDEPQGDYLRIDIYHHLFIYALQHNKKRAENGSTKEKTKRKVHMASSMSTITMNLLHYYEATDFMVFLISKVYSDEDIMTSKLVPLESDEAKNFITNCICMYEGEIISVFICHVIKDEGKKAEDLFKGLINLMKPSDIFNRGRLYNYALQRAEDLSEVHKLVISRGVSQRYENVLQDIDPMDLLEMQHNNQVKVHNFLVHNLYLRDVEEMPDTMQRIDWAFVKQHDFSYLVKCVWAHRKLVMLKIDVRQNNWTEVMFLVVYAFTSSAAIIVGGLHIMEHLLKTWPELDVNASYKSVTALHMAALKGNGEVVNYLLEKKELDINVRTGRRRKGNEDVPVEVVNYRLTERELVTDVHVGGLFAVDYVNSGKKYNSNRWNLSTHQTAIHIATTQGHAHIVKMLCDPPEPHQKRLRCHEEDEEDRTPLDILYAKVSEVGGDFHNGAESLSEIEKILMSNKDVQSGIDRLYRNRQVLVDAVSTILVGAALIAGVAFTGWLQPPLGYAQYYDLVASYPAPAGTYDSYLAVRGNLGIKAFALFNSLSFFFAIATIIVAADAAFPSRRYKYIGHIIQTMQLLLQRAITFLIISLVCVLGAFGSAAIVILPPSLFFRKDLVLTIIIGGGVCCVSLWQLLLRHSERVKGLNAYIASVIRVTNMF